MRLQSAIFGAAIAALTLTGCGEQTVVVSGAEPLLESLAPEAGADSTAKFVSVDGDYIGNATITDSPNGILIRVDLEGIPQGWHGIHLHQVGDCADADQGFKASGGHINPDGNQHGLLNPAGYERADMPNIYAGPDQRATAAFFNSYVRLNQGGDATAPVGPGAILMDADGFAMVVHESPDDHDSQPIGNAGPRIACAAFRN